MPQQVKYDKVEQEQVKVTASDPLVIRAGKSAKLPLLDRVIYGDAPSFKLPSKKVVKVQFSELSVYTESCSETVVPAPQTFEFIFSTGAGLYLLGEGGTLSSTPLILRNGGSAAFPQNNFYIDYDNNYIYYGEWSGTEWLFKRANTDGTGIVTLWNTGVISNERFCLIYDATKTAFLIAFTTNYGIWLVNADGSNPTAIQTTQGGRYISAGIEGTYYFVSSPASPFLIKRRYTLNSSIVVSLSGNYNVVWVDPDTGNVYTIRTFNGDNATLYVYNYALTSNNTIDTIFLGFGQNVAPFLSFFDGYLYYNKRIKFLNVDGYNAYAIYRILVADGAAATPELMTTEEIVGSSFGFSVLPFLS